MEESISNKLAEYRALNNRLYRYWKKLATESLAEADEKGIRRREIDLDNLQKWEFVSSNIIPIFKDGEVVDFGALLRLAEPRFQSLYRKYTQGLIKHNQLEKELYEYATN